MMSARQMLGLGALAVVALLSLWIVVSVDETPSSNGPLSNPDILQGVSAEELSSGTGELCSSSTGEDVCYEVEQVAYAINETNQDAYLKLANNLAEQGYQYQTSESSNTLIYRADEQARVDHGGTDEQNARVNLLLLIGSLGDRDFLSNGQQLLAVEPSFDDPERSESDRLFALNFQRALDETSLAPVEAYVLANPGAFILFLSTAAQ